MSVPVLRLQQQYECTTTYLYDIYIYIYEMYVYIGTEIYTTTATDTHPKLHPRSRATCIPPARRVITKIILYYYYGRVIIIIYNIPLRSIQGDPLCFSISALIYIYYD